MRPVIVNITSQLFHDYWVPRDCNSPVSKPNTPPGLAESNIFTNTSHLSLTSSSWTCSLLLNLIIHFWVCITLWMAQDLPDLHLWPTLENECPCSVIRGIELFSLFFIVSSLLLCSFIHSVCRKNPHGKESFLFFEPRVLS